ncbi:MAG TPA: DUF4870 domain-containing protein [Anaerolineales bacterium]|nr:DUF4870 domain-containing protein [Anaerolineales bacterium]
MDRPHTAEERIWSALSHLSSLAMGMGIVLPIVGWSEQRRKSNYASFQNLQALGYQSLGFTVWILSYLVVVIVVAVILLTMPGSGSLETIQASWLGSFSTVTFIFLALYLLLPIVAAVACALGKDFRYPILGTRLARYLGYDPALRSDEQVWLIDDHEYRWVAAAGHFSILILIWGMLAPLTVWILRGKHSLFLKFQSIQTLVYQASVTLFAGAGGFLYGVGLFALLFAMQGIGRSGGSSSPGIVILVIAGIGLLLGCLILLLVPLFHILGQWAGYRILKGEDYRYRLVGRLTDKWLAKESIPGEKPV